MDVTGFSILRPSSIAGFSNGVKLKTQKEILSMGKDNARVTVLGGCGAVGSVAVKTLVKHPEFSEVAIADYNLKKAREMAKQLRGKHVSAIKFDALNKSSVEKAIKGSDIVINCVGPFYNTVKPILNAVIKSRINYVDVCDDVDVTLDILDMTDRAKKAGITALIGMGSSPGVTNIIAKLVSEQFLEETDSVDIFHAHGGEPIEGEGVIGHRFHCMTIDIPMYLDGRLQYVRYFEESGIKLRQTFNFPVLGEVPIFPYPHPEQVTVPRYINLKQVTNKGTVVPIEYYNLIGEMCRLGLASKEPVKVKGKTVVPYDFAVAFIIKQRERILKETSFGRQRGCVSVVVKGKKEGKYREYRFHMASQSQALGEGTGIPVAMAAILMHQGKITEKGILPPEAAVNPADFLGLLPQIMDMDKAKSGGGSFSGFLIEKVDENGNVSKVDM
jgi:saccharopine dehydrogenase-like NADP-dependent oxidoreductase